MKRNVYLISVIAVGLLFVACDKRILSKITPGDYDGIVIEETPENVSQDFAVAKLTKSSDLAIAVKVTARTSQKTWDFDFHIARNGIQLTINQPIKETLELIHSKENCFETVADGLEAAKLCADVNEVSLELKSPPKHSLHIIIDFQNKKVFPPLESPKDYSEQELLQRAMDQGFSSRIEFERVVQAKLTAKLNLLNLLPHATTYTVLNVVTPSLVGFLKASGDLAPFLFPDKWFKAAQSKNLYRAELYSWISMKADAGNIAEGLIQTILTEQEYLGVLKKNYEKIALIRDQIKERERIGLMQIGSSDDITAVINSIQEAIQIGEQLMNNQMVALSSIVGFVNPSAVLSISPTAKEDSVERPINLDMEQLSRLAVERSFELLQINSLVAAAKDEKLARIFNFMDPNPDMNGGIGFGYPVYIKIISSKIQEFLIKRKESESLILSKVAQAGQQVALSVQNWKLANIDHDVQVRRVARLTNNMKTGINFTLADLVTALQGVVKDELNLITTRHQYYIYRSNLDRLIYGGAYTKFSQGLALGSEFENQMKNESNARTSN